MRSMIGAFYGCGGPRSSYHAWHLESARVVRFIRIISPTILFLQAKLHKQSETSFGEFLRQKIESKKGLDSDEDEETNTSKPPPTSNARLLERIRVPRNKSILPALCSWMRDGHKLGAYQLKVVFTRLDWQGKYAQALEIAEWLLEEKPFQLTEAHYARWLYYVGKVRGHEKAEETFSLIPHEFQTDVAYCKLFDIYLEGDKVDEAEGIIERMRNEGLPAPVYLCNNLITYYDKNLLRTRIPLLLQAMVDANISYNQQTYNILLACSYRNFDMRGLKKLWALMKADPSVKPNFVTYTTLASAFLFACQRKLAISALRHAESYIETYSKLTVKTLTKLISLYGALRREEDVGRLYQRLKDMSGQMSIPSYVTVVEAYGEAGSVESAAQVVREMARDRGWVHLTQYNALVGVYCKKGMIKKAEAVLKRLCTRHTPDVFTHTYLLLGYLKANQSAKAKESFGIVLKEIRGMIFGCDKFVSREWILTMHGIMNVLAIKGDARQAKSLWQALGKAKLDNFPRSYFYIKQVFEKAFGGIQDKGTGEIK